MDQGGTLLHFSTCIIFISIFINLKKIYYKSSMGLGSNLFCLTIMIHSCVNYFINVLINFILIICNALS